MKIEIVENIKTSMKTDNAYVKDVIGGKLKIDTKKAEKTMLITPELFAKLFSPERMKLLLKIKKNNIKNIYQLAKDSNRKYEAVYRDIKLLEGFGIITLKDKDREKIPKMEESISLPLLAAS
mgnify:CR=1 FL=1|tara:strand:+ start:80 stop:445 length:366 start_codon:yes stop_codon:yes gene_type:complete